MIERGAANAADPSTDRGGDTHPCPCCTRRQPGSAVSSPDWCGPSAGRCETSTAPEDAAGPSRTAADTAGSLQGARADGPGESRTRWRSHAPVPRRRRSSVRVSPAGRTVELCFAGVPEHLAERQAHEYCDHGPDEETARDPQDPHISSKGTGTTSSRRRSRLAQVWVRVQEDHPGERGSRVPRTWRRLAHDSPPGLQALIQDRWTRQRR